MKLNKEDEVVQVDSLLYALRPEAEHFCKTLTFTAAGDEKHLSKVIEKLDSHFIPQRNIIYERSAFHERKQLQNESVEEYARKLHELAATCEFVDKDDQIRDKFVIGHSIVT